MSYSFLPHTADVRMHVSGKSLEEIFRDGLLGMVSVMKPTVPEKKEEVRREVTVEAEDPTALLVDFLNEVLVWMHTKREAYTAVCFKKLTERSLEAEITGYRAEAFNEDIKAVTYHEADVKKVGEGKWSTNIIFDI